MKQTFNVLFFIRKTKLKKSGDTPIMLRITIEGQLVEMQLKRDVKPNLWNQNKERCTGKDHTSLEINRYLESVKLRLFEIHRKMEEEGKYISSMEIKRKFLGLDEEHKMLFQVFQEHNDKCRELIGKDYAKVTISRFDTCLKYMKEMALKQYHLKDIPLKEVNHAFIQDYIHFLKVEKNLSENTLIRYMKVIKKITNMALANEWMAKNPFVNIKFHEQEVHKEFLTKEELDILRTKEFDIPRLDLVRDVFLFQCWTGLAFIDVSELTEEHIVPDNEGNLWIRKARQKTKIMCNIPLLDIPLQILEKYKDHAYVRTTQRKGGIGTQLLRYLTNNQSKPILIGTWKDATWAIDFYLKNGFRQVSEEEKNILLKKYWNIPDRQVETSVVLTNKS